MDGIFGKAMFSQPSYLWLCSTLKTNLAILFQILFQVKMKSIFAIGFTFTALIGMFNSM